MSIDRLQLRAAIRLREIYLARHGKAIERQLVDGNARYQRALESTRVAIRQAATSGHFEGSLRIRRSLFSLSQIVRDTVNLTMACSAMPSMATPDLRAFLAELEQLRQEFHSLEFDFLRKSICATTDAITLEDINLGSFAIRICWTSLIERPSSDCFQLEALDPHPAASNDDVVHPHVASGLLCAGEAANAIAAALEHGRLADAFCLVHRVLLTYNPKSAHVRLDDWHGSECRRCGRAVSEDDSWRCDGCECEVCAHCSGDCDECLLPSLLARMRAMPNLVLSKLLHSARPIL